ncbi:MAG: hypothetical protein PGN21_09935 [Sphingomonas paucimobilis]
MSFGRKALSKSISFAPDRYAMLKDEADREGISFSALIERYLATAMEQRPEADDALPSLPAPSVATVPAVRIEPAPPAPIELAPRPARVLEAEPTVDGGPPPRRRQRYAFEGSTGLGVLIGFSAAIAVLLLVPGNGVVAEKIALAALGMRGDGYGAGVMLLNRHAGEDDITRYLFAAANIPDNRKRLFACAKRAGKGSDYRELEPCRIYVPGQRRERELLQGIVR